jgi:hypothetical protein
MRTLLLRQTYVKSESLLSSFSSIQINFISYFPKPAIFKSPTKSRHLNQSSKSCKQIIIVKHHHSILSHEPPLCYLRDDCHKQAVTHIRESRWFESMYTLQGKTQPTHHTPSTLDLHMALDHTSHVVHIGQPFTSSHEVEISPYTRKKSWQSKTDWPNHHLEWSHSSSHATSLE